MSTQIEGDLLNNPIALAIAVLSDRVRGLPREDREDFFELVEALTSAETDEDRESAARGMREILSHQTGGIQAVKLDTEPSSELRQWMDFVGGRIRQHREAAGLTQEQLAEKSGLPQSHISRLERGHHSPSSVTLERIAAALGIKAADFDPAA